jgi:Family of unknown function (DUF6498)
MFLLAKFVKLHQSKWMPFISMAVSLYCILLLNFDYQHIIILFIWEILLVMFFALIRMLYANGELPSATIYIEKLIWLILGSSLGVFFIALSISILSQSFTAASVLDELVGVLEQISILFVGQVEAIFSHYFRNNRYKTAVPRNQMISFIHVLVILAFLQLFTKHLIPSYPNLDQAVWGIVALVLVKFFVDLLFNFFQYSR